MTGARRSATAGERRRPLAGRPWRRGALATLAVAGACAALALNAAASGGPRVVVRDAGGDVVASAALPADGRFALAYRHSVYRAPAAEHFRVSGGGFALERITSASRRVLEYYELEGRYRGDALVPDHPARFTTMALAATQRGRRTLVVGGERFPLYGHGVHLKVEIDE